MAVVTELLKRSARGQASTKAGVRDIANRLLRAQGSEPVGKT